MGGGHTSQRIEAHVELILATSKQEPRLFLRELRDRLAEQCVQTSTSGLSRFFQRTLQDFEAMLWLRKDFGFAGAWTVREQNRVLAFCFGLQVGNKAWNRGRSGLSCGPPQSLRQARLHAIAKRSRTNENERPRPLRSSLRSFCL